MSETPLRLGVLSDIHLAAEPYPLACWHNRYDFAGLPDRLRAAVEQIVRAKVDALCVLGDVTHTGSAAAVRPLACALDAAEVPVLVVAGNHDSGHRSLTDVLPRASAAPPEGTVLRGWRIAGVQVEEGGWFGARLDSPPALDAWGEEPVVLLSHFPLHSYAPSLAALGMPYPGDLVGRQAIADALAARRAPTIVLSGHIHARARSYERGLLQLVTGALVEFPYECTLVEITSTEVTRTAVPLGGPAPDGPDPSLAPAEESFAMSNDRDGWLPSIVGSHERHRRLHVAALPTATPILTKEPRMKTSSASHILTTHTGSLPRPDSLARDLTLADGGRLDEAVRGELGPRVREAVFEAVARQEKAGIDVVSDGEQSKFGYATYVKERLTGFEGQGKPLALSEFADVPGFAPRVALELSAPGCSGPINYVGSEALQSDIANFKAALEARRVEEGFMNSASPGIICDYLADEHYGSEEAYLAALAEAMKTEYDTIVAAGFVLQLDCPDLALGRHLAAEPLSIADFRHRLELRVGVINHALRDIAADRVRIHMCWGNYESPHHHDVPLADILDIVLRINAGAFLFEGANPRHEHEWQVFEEIALPDGVVIVPGVIDTLTNYVEHPELVAQRIERYAKVVGPERVIAGTDCGFATFANYINVHPQITWRKLAALAEGARIASDRLSTGSAREHARALV